jgi:hypothetical protein
MNIEMNNNMEMSVTSLLLKTLENATREYARVCVKECAKIYGFDGDEALVALKLEKLNIQVREMKKRGAAEKKEKAVKEKVVKEKPKKVAKEKAEKVVVPKPSIPLPFVRSMVSEECCQGLAYNGGLFTQCQKMRMDQSSYCKVCQVEADGNASGAPNNGTVEQRLGCDLMEFRDPKGRNPIAYSKIMEKKKLTREQVELEAGKLNIVIDDVHFAVVEKKKKETAGRPKAAKKSVKVIETGAVEDLFAELVDKMSEDETATVLMTSSEDEEEMDSKPLEKAERDMMKEADTESKKVEKASKKKEKDAVKEQKLAEEKAAKEQKLAEEKAAKEAKKQEELAAKEAKKQEELAAKEAKKLQLEAEKAAKEQKLAEEKAAKEAKKLEELAAKEAKKLELEAEKAAKEAKKLEELAAKEAKKLEDLAAKEAKKLQLEQKKAEAEALAKQKKAPEKKAPEKKVAAKKTAEKKVEEPKKAEAVAEAAPKKVTVKRITIDGKQYLKTPENLLYDPETKEEMGIYDPDTNTIKELPEDSDEEVEEDGYTSE